MHIIADMGYPLKNWCITPYKKKRALTDEEEIFNKRQSSSRMMIERAFTLLKGKFRRLKFIETVRPAAISNVIMGCCILHNICLGYDEDDYNNYLEFYEEPEDGDIYDHNEPNQKRQNICQGIRDMIY